MYYVIEIPVNAEGHGPATPEETVKTLYEVWDDTCVSIASAATRELAEVVAKALNAALSPNPQPVAVAERVRDSFGNDLVERELVSIVLRMTRHLPKDKPAAMKLHDGVLDYLRRKKLLPSPLRADETLTQSNDTTPPSSLREESERLQAEDIAEVIWKSHELKPWSDADKIDRGFHLKAAQDVLAFISSCPRAKE